MAVTTVSQLDGYFKEVFADQIENLIPDNALLTKMVKFSTQDKIGQDYHQPVILTNEHGVTYAAAGDGAFTLNSSIPMSTKDAIVASYQHLIRSQIGYEAASKAASKGKAAFGKVTELVVRNMLESMTQRLEIDMLYGQTANGTCASSANASGTSTVVTISDASWAVGVWAGAENAEINFYDEADALISSGADAVFTITSVDIDNKAITVTGTSGGISALDSNIGISGKVIDIYWKGSFGKQMAGIDKIITNTGSLFNISAATYNLWKGTSYAVGGNMSVSALFTALDNAIGRGLSESVCALMAPTSWTKLNNELAGDRRYDGSYSKTKGTQGNESIELFHQNGMIEIKSHNLVKGGEAFLLPIKRIKRIGSRDISFNNPGTGDKFFRELNDNAGFELRAYSDQAIFIETPAKCVKMTGVTY